MVEQLKSQVINTFTKLRNAIDLREKLLLRQLDVLKQREQLASKIDFSELSFQTRDDEEEILQLLRNYGHFQNIELLISHLENDNENEEEENSKDQLYEKKINTDLDYLDNKKLSESIINLTIKESQDLIKKSSDLVTDVHNKLKIVIPTTTGNNNIDKTCNQGESIKQSDEGSKNDVKVKDKEGIEGKLKRNNPNSSSKKKILKNISNLTLNNCGNGSIILKNISNLTINTCKQTPKQNVEDEARGGSESICKESKKCDVYFPQCDFYEKLISENEALKRNIVNQSIKRSSTFPDPITAVCCSPKGDPNEGTYSINSISNDTSISSIVEEEADGFLSTNKHDKSRKSENLGFTEPAIEEITTRNLHLAENFIGHPPIIQCWLSNMYLETETEEANNIEILEYSNIA